MKKIISVLLLACMLVCFVACGSNDETDGYASATTTQMVDEGMSTEQTTETYSQLEETEAIVLLNKFEQFEKGLEDKSIKFETNEKSAEMVGAKQGYGYIFEDGTAVELYLFDTSSDSYAQAVNSGKLAVAVFGITLDVTFNDDICIYFNDENALEAEIMQIFNNIK